MTITLLVCLCLIGISNAAQSTQRRLLLVCGSESTISSLSPKEVRKLFLGVPITKDGVRLIPLRNASDPLVEEVFLQRMIFLSKRSYERQLLSRVFRFGGVLPPVFKNLPELINELHRSPGAVSYMWSGQAAHADDLKSIGVLWEGTVD